MKVKQANLEAKGKKSWPLYCARPMDVRPVLIGLFSLWFVFPVFFSESQERYLLMLHGTKQNGKWLPPEGKEQNSTDPRTTGNVNLDNLFTFSTAFRLDFKLFGRQHCVLEYFGTFYPILGVKCHRCQRAFFVTYFFLISRFSYFLVFVLFSVSFHIVTIY